MAEMFRLITPITYWILIGLWSFILYFYVKTMWNSKTNQLFKALVIILAIDAFRTLFESFYFGLWYTSLSGLLPLQIGDFLTRPEIVIIPKIINVVAAIIIIVLLLKRWLPKEEQEQDRLGAALHDSEEEFQAFFENNPLSCWIEDLSEVQNHFEDLREKGISDIESYFDEYPEELVKFGQVIKIKDVNQATLDLHKAENKEELYQGLEKTFTPESFEVFRKEIVDLWNGQCQSSYDGLVKTLDDELRYVQVNYRVMPGCENTLENVLITLVDNTSKWLAEQSLLVSENRLNLAMQFTNDGLYDWDLETKKIYYSPGWKRMLGYQLDELPDDFTVWEKLTHPDDVKVSWQMLDEVIEGKRSHFELEYRMKHKNGNWVEILSRDNVDINNAGKAVRVVGTHVDITERKKTQAEKDKLESRLQQAQKMEAIGTLAGGIAHDFNNILSVILGYADMAKEDAPPGTRFENDLTQVVTAANRAKDLVQQILAFSRQAEIERIPIKIQLLIKEGLKMLRSSIPSTISITEDIDPQSGVILADPTQIHQILMNLCTNAYHTMEEKGGVLSVTLKTTFVEPNDKEMLLHVNPGEYVEFNVADTGAGMGTNTLDKIFDPYFTTKEVGKGTGMGLAIIHGIMKEYGGAITVESMLGKGSTFHVYFPVVDRDVLPERKVSEDIIGGKERILFIDDEEILAEMGKNMLERLGYRVTVRRSSLEALSTFQNTPDKFDLVITDQTMPNMTGSDLSRRMMQIRPDIPIILCTGYSSTIDEGSAKFLGIKEFALKPLTKEVIGKLIRKVLDGQADSTI